MAESTSEVELDAHLRSRLASRAATSNTDAATSQDDVVAASQIADAGVPEGGYGWIALSGCGILCFWFVGTTYSWGVIQEKLSADGVSSTSALSFVGSLTITFISLLAVVNARLLTRFGSRAIALAGVTILGAGEILSGFVSYNVGGLFATTGVIMGIGVSLCFIVISSVPAQYFSRKRGLANGIVYASGGLGGTVISFMIGGLLQRVGTSWTFRIIGLLTLVTGLPAAWFVKDRIQPKERPLVDWRLFKDSRFTILFAAGAVATFPLLVPPFFLPLFSKSIHLSASTAPALVAVFNLASAVGRITAGFLSDRFGPVNTLIASLFLSAVSMLTIWPISETLAPLAVFAIVNGAANGGFFALMPTVAGQVFGSARVGTVMGMLVTGWAGGYLMGAPIAGYLLSAFGGESVGFQAYRPAIYYAGSMTMGATVLVVLARSRISTSLWEKV